MRMNHKNKTKKVVLIILIKKIHLTNNKNKMNVEQ